MAIVKHFLVIKGKCSSGKGLKLKYIKHLMTGPKGNSEFCFPETSMFPEAKPRGTLRLEGKQNSLFPEGPVIKCFVIPPNSKYRV